MKTIFEIIGITTTAFIIILVLIRLVNMYLIDYVKMFYYRFIYHNYEIWFSSKKMNKEQCISWLSKYNSFISNGEKPNRNFIRFNKAIQKRLDYLNK